MTLQAPSNSMILSLIATHSEQIGGKGRVEMVWHFWVGRTGEGRGRRGVGSVVSIARSHPPCWAIQPNKEFVHQPDLWGKCPYLGEGNGHPFLP